MLIIEILFWTLIGLIFYSYVGYGLVLYLVVRIKRIFIKPFQPNDAYQVPVTLFVAAYNEEGYIEDKVKNCLQQHYPKDLLNIIFVTDGSTDQTPHLIEKYSHKGVELYHENKRAGKIGAMNRGMSFVKTPIVIFTDANAMLNLDAVAKIVRHYENPKVGCIAGEKRILNKTSDSAAGSGEGIYWKYESALKKWDSELKSVVGAAGELFSIRTELFEHVEKDTLLDDFVMSLRVAAKNYQVVYEPEAYAIESSSASIKEELKRKIRICAGGIQSILRLKTLLNPFKYGVLTWQYISHRVLRWTVTPLALLLVIPFNVWLAFDGHLLYQSLLIAQIVFYSLALLGWYLENKEIRVKVLFIPFYFFIMNLSVFLGFARFIKGKQSVIWERAKRA